MMILASAKNLLLPRLWVISKETGKDLDLMVDYSDDTIVLLSSDGPKGVLFTRHEIEDGLLPEFRQRVEALLK